MSYIKAYMPEPKETIQITQGEFDGIDEWEAIRDICIKFRENENNEKAWREGENAFYEFENFIMSAGIETPFAEIHIDLFCLAYMMAKNFNRR